MVIEPDVIAKLDRVARMDGWTVRQAPTKARARAWGGRLAIFAGPHFRFASNSIDALRAWLHVHARNRPA